MYACVHFALQDLMCFLVFAIPILNRTRVVTPNSKTTTVNYQIVRNGTEPSLSKLGCSGVEYYRLKNRLGLQIHIRGQ